MTWGKQRKLTVRIILEDGSPEGIRKVSVGSWNGSAVVCSRAHYPSARKMGEFDRPGVYVLHGEDEGRSLIPRVYIGEADILRDRIESHSRNKEWWNRLIAFSSADEFFNKAHVQYVESRLVQLATDAKRAILDNKNMPLAPRISEADIADCERFLDYMLLLLPILGVTAFEAPPRPPEVEKASAGLPGVPLILDSRGAFAEGRNLPEGFLVLKGATGRNELLPSADAWIAELRKKLVEQGVLQIEGERVVLLQDYVFSSPSAAAGVFVGGNTAGPRRWHDKQGRTLREIEDAALQAGEAKEGVL